MLFESFKIAVAAVFIKKSVLKITAALFGLPCRLAHEAGGGNEFHVDLHPLTGMIHLLIGFGDIHGIGRFNGHLAPLSQEPVQARDGSLVALLPQLDPEHHKAGVGVTAAHVVYEPDLFRRMLIRVTVRTVGAILQGSQCAVIAFHPAVDILPVRPVPYRRLRHSMFLRV